MTWRTFVIIGALLAAVILNGFIMFRERTAKPEEANTLSVARKDRLIGISFTAGARIKNFKSFGLTEDQASLAADRTQRLQKDYKDKFTQMLKDSAEDVGWALCAGDTGLPQRYAALAFLVQEENGTRKVIPPELMKVFEVQDWWDIAKPTVDALYAEFELNKESPVDTTVMGGAAILLSTEVPAANRESPWGRRAGTLGNWSWGSVVDDNPGIDKRVIEYFATMHLLTEMANTSGGICE